MITKQHAIDIKKRLKAEVEKDGPHKVAHIYHEGKYVASFHIRHSSKKDSGHGHIPKQLGLTPRETIELAICTMTKEAYFEILKERGSI